MIGGQLLTYTLDVELQQTWPLLEAEPAGQVMELRLKKMQYEVAFFVDPGKIDKMNLSFGPHWVMLQEVRVLPLELDPAACS